MTKIRVPQFQQEVGYVWVWQLASCEGIGTTFLFQNEAGGVDRPS